MLINLKHVLAHKGPLKGHCVLELSSRLPIFLQEPCQLECSYEIVAEQDYYLLTMRLYGQLHCICQRCLQAFQQAYDTTICVAICTTELRAEQLMNNYECIVASDYQCEMEAIALDELYFSVPAYHSQRQDCDGQVLEFLSENS